MEHPAVEGYRAHGAPADLRGRIVGVLYFTDFSSGLQTGSRAQTTVIDAKQFAATVALLVVLPEMRRPRYGASNSRRWPVTS